MFLKPAIFGTHVWRCCGWGQPPSHAHTPTSQRLLGPVAPRGTCSDTQVPQTCAKGLSPSAQVTCSGDHPATAHPGSCAHQALPAHT